jgi:two-component system cell cycle response regulator CtrA
MSELQRLRDRIAELEELAGIGDDDVALIKTATGLPMSACRILGAIRKRRGISSRDMIYGLVYGDRPECDQPEMKILDVHVVRVVRIRRALKPHGITIETVWGVGWSMTDEHRAALAAMMESYLGQPASVSTAHGATNAAAA